MIDAVDPASDGGREDAIFFGRYCAAPQTRQFLVDGRPCEMGSRAFDLLMTLLRSRGKIVSKGDIISLVWPDTYVDEVNLRVQIATVRKALGEDRDIVKTVPGRGYLLAVDETAAPPETVDPPAVEASAALPRPLSSLIGRKTELAELETAFTEARLVTLVGSGGIGKTRLAIDLGWHLAPRFADGVRLIDLAPLADPAMVASATATALGVQISGAGATVADIAAVIGKQRLLLIFDNCEHLVEAAAALIAELLTRLPGLSVLATSQATLRIPGEQVYRVNPLTLPPNEATEIAGFDAVALFVERARAADRRFQLGAGNAASAAEICRRLDGVPLALEMAAARLPLLGVEGLRVALGERLQMLRASPQAAELRYRTLRATAEWSYGLLDADEKQVFSRLGILVGSFSLDAAIAVSATAGADRWDAVDALGRLIDKSLVTTENSEPPRYRLLETLRLFALDQLAASGEKDAIAERHARYFAAQLDRAALLWEQTPDAEWLAACQPALDDARAALDWAFGARSRRDLAVFLASNASCLWLMLKLTLEGRAYCERAIALIDAGTSPAIAARLLKHAAGFWRADAGKALALAERSAEFYALAEDRLGRAGSLSFIGGVHTTIGQFEAAEAALAEAWQVLAPSDHTRTACNVLMNTAILACLKNDLGRGKSFFFRALDLARTLPGISLEETILHNLAELAFQAGAIDEAILRAKELVGRLKPGDRRTVGSWCSLASYLILGSSPLEARPYAEKTLSLIGEEDGHFLRVCLEHWAILGALEGRLAEAARLMGFTDAALARSGDFQQEIEQKIRHRLGALLEAALTPAEIRDLAAEGAGWREAQAIRFATERLAVPVAI